MTYEDFFEEWHNDKEFVKCHTSGSTGQPKEIVLPKIEMLKSARRTLRHFSLNPQSHFHSCISPDFIGGKMMAVRAIDSGAQLTWETPSNRPLEGIKFERIDLLAVVPSQMVHILDHLTEIPIIGAIIIGGSAIPDNLRKRIAESGLNAWETYGMTETASHIALRHISSKPTSFEPLEGIKVSTDSESRLVIEIEGWQKITTNDMAEISESGNFRIIGRADNVIISGGKKIHPEETERILEKELGVPVLITSEPDEKWGERVIMTIEDEYGADEDNKIISICKKCIPSESVPKRIVHGTIPRTPNGKKQRKR